MVNKQFYQEVLPRLRDAVRRKRPELWENQTWMLHHDNAPAHASLLFRNYLGKHQTSVVPHPPYSPNLAPADFFLFPKLKTTLKGRHFQTMEEIQENVIRELPPSQKVRSGKHSNNGRNVGNDVSPVEGTTLKGTVLKML